MRFHDVQFIKSASQWRDLPTDARPEVAFLGRSNVGKSSLLNMLVGRKALARISHTPGKTQTFNFYLIQEKFYLVDLPGYGYAKVAKTQRAQWGKFIESYLRERDPLRLVFHLVDSRHPPTALDEAVMETMKGGHVPYLVLLTKADKLKRNDRAKTVARAQRVLKTHNLEVPVILTSAKDQTGRNDILRWIKDLGIS